MKHRIIQYIIIILILSGITGGYFYYQSKADQKINASKVNNLTSGLAGYWTFDGADTTATTALDMSTNDNVGTISGTVTKTIGKIGQALDFNGSTGYLTIGANPNLGITTGITECAWIYKKSNSTIQYIMHYANTADGDDFGMKIDTSGTLVATDFNGDNITSATAIPLNAWQHVCATLNIIPGLNNDDWKIYINGALNKDAEDTPNYNPFIDTQGSRIGVNINNVRFFNGLIDEARIYNRVLSASEITELYQQGQTKINASEGNKLTNGLTWYWTMDGNDINWGTNTVTNKVSGGSNGTTSSMDTTNAKIGKIGQALYFDGTGEQVSYSSTSMDGAGAISVSAWVNLDGFNPGGTASGIFKKGGAYATSTPALFVNTDGTVTFFMCTVGGSCGVPMDGSLTTATTIPINQWRHVVATWDGTNMYVYVNGVKDVNTDTTVGHALLANSGGVIGATSVGEGQPFKGKIDELRVYNRAITQSEITELYQQGQTKINASQTNKLTSGLINYWTFDGPDVSGTTVTDKAGSKNGTLVNGPVPAIGKIGQGMEFLGGNDQMTFSSVALTNTHSVSMWIYPKTSTNEYGCLFAQGAELGIWYRGTDAGVDDRKITFFYSGVDHHNSTALTNQQWSHVVVVNNSGTVTFYVNGQANGTATGAPGYNANYMGEDSSGAEEFRGKIDEVRVYSRALSQSEVTELYNMGR